ncbi:hypothetical protein AWH56_013745 [Anaerobacillus isosaccharinicus]|uniref:Uncharacterized protein n=1 Tax=Anaerobacillus isosaccharinicus TaxID=1532552 RepID=A0A1S2KV89_9BACI|nr:hypothetical protein [Anaerobacillus isosaccharinicus]MBA5588039.1 hypothetical protein [Anaerobacillus isosaccharinicus]QOY33821.1 hypothetical protein AWH56_013745 [Anaerobacillus isosaccharinicus]
MINQPDPVYSYTIPYYTSMEGETSELFVSEKTYEKYLEALTKEKLVIINGTLHPISQEYGEVTTTLFDIEKAIIVIGTKDHHEYTNELLDIAIAQELEKIILLEKEHFFRFLYGEDTPNTIQMFIDDLQQTLEEIHIAKRLKKEGYRISQREELLAADILENAVQWSAIRDVSPYENEHGLFLLTKLFFLSHVEETLFQQYKKQLQSHYPLLFVELEKLLKETKKLNLSTLKGREKALVKAFTKLRYLNYVKKVSIKEIGSFCLRMKA